MYLWDDSFVVSVTRFDIYGAIVIENAVLVFFSLSFSAIRVSASTASACNILALLYFTGLFSETCGSFLEKDFIVAAGIWILTLTELSSWSSLVLRDGYVPSCIPKLEVLFAC